MTRAAAIVPAEAYFDTGGFAADLARRVADLLVRWPKAQKVT